MAYTNTSGSVWGAWNDDTSSQTTTYTTTAEAWTNWNTGTATNDATDTAWIYWQGTGGNNRVVYDCDAEGRMLKTSYRRMRRQQASALRRSEKVRRKGLHTAELERRRKQSADDKARQLLEDVLGLEQYKVYRETGRILIHGQKFDWIVQSSGVVKRLEKDKVIDLCVRLQNPWKYPKDDNIVGLALTAKLNEDHLVEKANTIRTQAKGEIPKCAVLDLAV